MAQRRPKSTPVTRGAFYIHCPSSFKDSYLKVRMPFQRKSREILAPGYEFQPERFIQHLPNPFLIAIVSTSRVVFFMVIQNRERKNMQKAEVQQQQKPQNVRTNFVTYPSPSWITPEKPRTRSLDLSCCMEVAAWLKLRQRSVRTHRTKKALPGHRFLSVF